MIKVSVTLTTCGRVDLLNDTIQSFNRTNTYPIDEFIIINDDPSTNEIIHNKYDTCGYDIIYNNQNLGQKKCLDIIFNKCKNEYIFHLEDDWIFENDSCYIKNSISILENNKDVHQVWVRHEEDNPHKSVGGIIRTDDYTYKIIDPYFRECWNGYSWNPGLRRKSDYLKMFPNGIDTHVDEMECAKYVRNFQYKTILLLPTVCRHIGYGRTTQ